MFWFRKVEPVKYSLACVSCGCSTCEPVQMFISTKEVLLDSDFAAYIREFIDFKFERCPEGAVVLKWVPTDGIKIYSTVEADFGNTTRLLRFLQVKFEKAKQCKEKE